MNVYIYRTPVSTHRFVFVSPQNQTTIPETNEKSFTKHEQTIEFDVCLSVHRCISVEKKTN